MSTSKPPQPLNLGQDLYLAVKAGFVLQGTSFGSWCNKHGVTRQNATMALRGGWRGPKARKLISRIVKDAGIEASKVAA